MADHSRRLPSHRIAQPPTIDATISPEEWPVESRTTGFSNPGDDSKDPFGTEVWIAYDREAIYCAIRCTDPQPNLIRAVEYRRDSSVNGDDHVIVGINPFKTFQENDFTVFEVGAGGGANVEFAGGRASKREWQGEWEVKSRVTDTGWEMELRIPWRILQLPGAGVRDVEINFGRRIPRLQTTYLWSNLGSNERFERNGVWQGVEIPESVDSSTLQVLPYQILGTGRQDGLEFNTGFDARYQVGNRLTSLLSVNPDFKNIENSVLSLDYSRFERLADERRPFFVEGEDTLRFGGRSVRMFASQRLRSFDVGAKAFGRISDGEMLSALATTRFDRETAAVMRYERTFSTGNSVRAGAVHLDDKVNGIRNTAAGFEAFAQGERWGGDIFYDVTDDSVKGKGHRLDLDVTYRERYVNGFLGFQRITQDFTPRLGFAPRRGFHGVQGGLFYDRESSKGPIAQVDGGVSFSSLDAESGGIFQRGAEAWSEVDFRNGLEVGASWGQSEYFGKVDRFHSARVSYPDNNPYRRFSLGVTGGTVAGEDYHDLGLGGTYRFANRLTLSGSFGWLSLGSEKARQHIVSLNYELDAYRSIAGRMVLRDDKINGYLAYRQSGNLGAEYFLILGDPNADEFQSRIIGKVVFPLDFTPKRKSAGQAVKL